MLSSFPLRLDTNLSIEEGSLKRRLLSEFFSVSQEVTNQLSGILRLGVFGHEWR